MFDPKILAIGFTLTIAGAALTTAQKGRKGIRASDAQAADPDAGKRSEDGETRD